MGLLDFLKKKPEEKKAQTQSANPSSKHFQKDEEDSDEEMSREICALCNAAGADKKWAGQWWHKKCIRLARRGAKGMI